VARARLSDAAVELLIETPEAIESDPRWVPGTLEFVYTVQDTRAEAPRLRLFDPLTGRSRSPLRGSGRVEQSPTVSRDGRRVAFASLSGGSSAPRGVLMLQPMTGVAELIGKGAPRVTLRAPEFSPDAAEVAAESHLFEGRRETAGADIWLLTMGAANRVLSADPALADLRPGFSNDGRQVFFSRSPFELPGVRRARERRGESPPLGGGDVCRVRLAEEDIDCVAASTEAREFDAAPSPTRAELVYVREQDGESELFLAGLDGGDERQLTALEGRSLTVPRWSPNGERIAFVAGEGDDRAVLVVERDGRLLFETPGHSPAWAPPFP
jgi:Tol biopolymer transport system component